MFNSLREKKIRKQKSNMRKILYVDIVYIFHIKNSLKEI